jgi:hypothetical protein
MSPVPAESDLIAVNEAGEMHPIGKDASRRMRARRGEFRLLPSPTAVVMLRAVEVSQGRVAETGARIRLAGELARRGDLCDILGFLGQVKWRGRLLVSDHQHVRVLLLENGNVVGVQTNAPPERLGQVLFHFGILTQPEVERVLEACKAGARFGEAATRVGGLEEGVIYEYLGHQIREVVCATLDIRSGAFSFIDDFENAARVSGHAISVDALVSEAVTRMDELDYFRRHIPSAQHVPVRQGDTPPRDEHVAQIYRRINGQRSVEELGRLTGVGEFGATKALHALVRSGHVAIRSPRTPGGEGAIIDSANEALRRVFQTASAAGKEQALRDNLASFMQGMGLYPILFRDAGPGPDGSLDAARVLENLEKIAATDDRERVLKDLLHQLASFALFTTGALLGEKREAPLRKSISQTMRALRPGV